jgi:hypothetical protein
MLPTTTKVTVVQVLPLPFSPIVSSWPFPQPRVLIGVETVVTIQQSHRQKPTKSLRFNNKNTKSRCSKKDFVPLRSSATNYRFGASLVIYYRDETCIRLSTPHDIYAITTTTAFLPGCEAAGRHADRVARAGDNS